MAWVGMNSQGPLWKLIAWRADVDGSLGVAEPLSEASVVLESRWLASIPGVLAMDESKENDICPGFLARG